MIIRPILAITPLALALAGCGGQSSSPSSATACNSVKWPQRVPDVVGANASDALTGALLCFNVTAAIAPDGHDILTDPANSAYKWKIASVSPARGTVSESEAITLRVKQG